MFVSGKHYYAAAKHMEENDIQDTAIVRLEQLCPFPTKELQDEVSRYKHVKSKPPSQSIYSFEVRSSYKMLRSNRLAGTS